jgi:hypothetical protein
MRFRDHAKVALNLMILHLGMERQLRVVLDSLPE